MSKLKVLSFKVTEPLNELILKYIELDTHVTKSDFVRSAIREKIVRDAPHLITELMNGSRER